MSPLVGPELGFSRLIVGVGIGGEVGRPANVDCKVGEASGGEACCRGRISTASGIVPSLAAQTMGLRDEQNGCRVRKLIRPLVTAFCRSTVAGGVFWISWYYVDGADTLCLLARLGV